MEVKLKCKSSEATLLKATLLLNYEHVCDGEHSRDQKEKKKKEDRNK